ncbi:MAG TPA: hypothetical protein ENF36_01815 [Desulfobacteraceae bacterium]|nr:hypothetical protein [Desulfobacteraceae bacterium]
MNPVIALTSALSDYLSLKTSYEIKYDHEPVPSTLKKPILFLHSHLLLISDRTTINKGTQ